MRESVVHADALALALRICIVSIRQACTASDSRGPYSQHALDDYGVLKCINYIRRTVADGTDPLPSLKQGPEAFADDKYLQPILEDDGLLCHDFTEGQDGGCDTCDAPLQVRCKL